MIFTWLLFTLMLFVLEPLVLHRLIKQQAKLDPQATFIKISRLHYLLLTISMITIAWAVAASHGFIL